MCAVGACYRLICITYIKFTEFFLSSKKQESKKKSSKINDKVNEIEIKKKKNIASWKCFVCGGNKKVLFGSQ